MSAEGSEENPLIWKAQLCEGMERYEDMAKFMKQAAESDESFDSNQRNLFSVAYKNVIGGLRSAWRVVSARENKLSDDDVHKGYCKELRVKIEGELKSTCEEVVKIIDKLLDKEEKADDATKVFYMKMKGDYFRYLAEISSSQRTDDVDDENSPTSKAKEIYKKAAEVAENLSSTHPIRLGLALNFSVFYYEILSQPSEACGIAKKAFDDAIADLDHLQEDSYKDSTLIMQLLRDNLTLWTSDGGKEEEDD